MILGVQLLMDKLPSRDDREKLRDTIWRMGRFISMCPVNGGSEADLPEQGLLAASGYNALLELVGEEERVPLNNPVELRKASCDLILNYILELQ